MKTENPIILNTGGIGAVSIDMTHTNCATAKMRIQSR